MAQAAIPIAIAVAAAAASAGAAELLTPTVKPPAEVKAITPSDAAAAANKDTEFRRRKGAGANELTGGGAEAPSPGGKTLLGQ